MGKNAQMESRAGKAAVQKYTQKMILNMKSWMGNVLFFSAMSGSIKFAAGCGISNGGMSVYVKNKKLIRSSRCRTV